MLTWEYPPRVIGGLSRHVEGLSRAMVSLGHEVHVVTLDFPGAAALEQEGSLYVHRVSFDLPAPNFHSWVLLFNHFFEKKVGEIAHRSGAPDLVHVHDWLTVSAGVAVKHLLRVPLVMTFHSTEASRSFSSRSVESSMVEGLEWWGSYEAARVIAVSSWMRGEVVARFGVPQSKVAVIPNAVDASKFRREVDIRAARGRWGFRDGDRVIMAVGRLTSQKGFDDLIRALRRVRSAVPQAKVLLVGEGYMRGELEELARTEGVADSVKFAGFVGDADLVSAMKSSDLVVVPSRFEPFGIIALEAMAAGTPLVVSRVGGLAEVVDHMVDGVEVEPGDPASISEAVVGLLGDRALARRLASRGSEKAKAYNWESSAGRTLDVYKEAMGESRYE